MSLTTVVAAEKEQDDMNKMWLWSRGHLSLGRSDLWKSRKETWSNFLCWMSGWSTAQPIWKLAGNDFAGNCVKNVLKYYFIRNLGVILHIFASNRKIWLRIFPVHKAVVSHCVEAKKIVIIWVCHNSLSFLCFSIMIWIQCWYTSFHREGTCSIHLGEQLTPLKLPNPQPSFILKFWHTFCFDKLIVRFFNI